MHTWLTLYTLCTFVKNSLFLTRFSSSTVAIQITTASSRRQKLASKSRNTRDIFPAKYPPNTMIFLFLTIAQRHGTKLGKKGWCDSWNHKGSRAQSNDVANQRDAGRRNDLCLVEFCFRFFFFSFFIPLPSCRTK